VLTVVYLEQLTGVLYLDSRDDVDQYASAMGWLVIEAAPMTGSDLG